MREAFDRSVALVMGVNAYRHGIPPLWTAVPDAEAIGALLEAEHGFTNIVLRDGEVTRGRVRSLLRGKLRDALGSELGERDRLLLYFAGHGLTLPSERGPEGQLLLADADVADCRTFLAMDELRTLISALACRHVFVVLDCCFAGTFRWAGQRGDRSVAAPAYRETLERFVDHRAWQVLVSASHDQPAHDAVAPSELALAPEVVGALRSSRIEAAWHSPFAAALLRGLRGGADYTRDGLIVATELELFVRDSVEQATHVQQTPQLYKLENHDRGEFVFQVPGTILDLASAPALSPAACPYQGLQPYTAAQRDGFFGRARAVTALCDRVEAKLLTVVLGPSGAGKSSLVAAGLVPALRARGWTVIETRPDARFDETLRELIPQHTAAVPAHTLRERVAAWLSIHAGPVCLVIDQAEDLELLAAADLRDRVLGDLAHALAAHGLRLRVVLTVRSEFDPVFRSSALAPLWADAAFVVPALSHYELREIIERPARAVELAFEPASLVDTLIDEVLQAPGGLPLLSFALRELYLHCVARNTDRLLTEDDYARMGRLGGALAQRASALLQDLVATDPAYAATARRVFLRMVVERDGEWARRRAHRDELLYADEAESRRAGALLASFRAARLVVFDKDAWEPAHDWLVRAWPTFSMWRIEFGARALALQAELADAARRWQGQRRAADLWSDDPRLAAAVAAWRAPGSWLNAREHGFVAASVGRRRRRIYLALTAIAVAAAAGFAVWDLYYRTHVDYFRNYVRRWGEPEGVDSLTVDQARGLTSSVKLVRRGHLGHVVHVELVHSGDQLARDNPNDLGYAPELELGQKAEGQRMLCQWDFAYDTDSDAVSAEIAKDRTGRVVYQLQYRNDRRGPGDRRKAEFLDELGDDARIPKGDAERIEFIRSDTGLDIEKHYTLRHGEPAWTQDGISIEKLEYDQRGHLVRESFFDDAGKPTFNKDRVAGYHTTFDARGNPTERAFFDDTGKPAWHKDGVASYRAMFDARGNETERAFFDDTGKPTRDNKDVADYRITLDARGNRTEVAFFDEHREPTPDNNGVARYRSTFDARDNETERAFFDTAGNPARDKVGIAGYRATFDAHGNRTEIAFFDEHRTPIRNKYGVAGYRTTFDARGNQTKLAYFDEHRDPGRNKDGIAGYRAAFDARGNQTEVTYFDRAGHAIPNKEGVAGFRSTFDARGNETERVFFDEQARTVRHKDGYVGYRMTHDARGNDTGQVYFDETGTPIRNKNGVAGYRSTYDMRDNQTEIAQLDEAGNPTRGTNSIAGFRATFDARGNRTEVVFFGEAGKPTRNEEGIAGYRSTFDARGNVTERRFFDETGNPIRDKDGHAGWRAALDAHGKETGRTYLDEAGQPVSQTGSVGAIGDQRGPATR